MANVNVVDRVLSGEMVVRLGNVRAFFEKSAEEARTEGDQEAADASMEVYSELAEYLRGHVAYGEEYVSGAGIAAEETIISNQPIGRD